MTGAGGSGSGSSDRQPKKASPAKKTTAKKATGKKTSAAKKTPARKAAAKKTSAAKKSAPARRTGRGGTPPGGTSSRLGSVLRDLRQGDLISLGAVSIVGRGPSDITEAAETRPGKKELWALTVESDVGWYAIVSGPCDIERSPSVEPCLAIAPVRRVTDTRYAELRSGYSPREFPLPSDKLARALGVQASILYTAVDLRYVTSLDKNALMDDSVAMLRPLSAPAQKRFGLWVGDRYARPAHPGRVEEDILGRLSKLVKRLAKAYAQNGPKGRSAQALLVSAAEEWLISANERMIDIYVIVSEASARAHQFYDEAEGHIDSAKIDAAADHLRSDLVSALPRGGGYAITVKTRTLWGLRAAEYVSLERWSWADEGDPLVSEELGSDEPYEPMIFE